MDNIVKLSNKAVNSKLFTLGNKSPNSTAARLEDITEVVEAASVISSSSQELPFVNPNQKRRI
jgi:hypothetical protein